MFFEKLIVILQYKNKAKKWAHQNQRHLHQNKMSRQIWQKPSDTPARIAIIDYLASQESCICKDIVAELPLSQPTISQHLKELKNVGLVKGTVSGNRVCYCLDVQGLKRLMKYCNAVMQKINQVKSSCCGG